MKVLGIVLAVVLTAGLIVLIAFQVNKLVIQVKEYRKRKKELANQDSSDNK